MFTITEVKTVVKCDRQCPYYEFSSGGLAGESKECTAMDPPKEIVPDSKYTTKQWNRAEIPYWCPHNK